MLFRKLFNFSARHFSSHTKIVDLSKKCIGTSIQIKGWIKAQRNMKDVLFVDVNDGSTSKNLQVVINKNLSDKPGHGSSICAKGMLSQTPKGQLELIAESFQLINKCQINEFPFQPKITYPPEYIREYLHLRPRVSSFSSMLRVRHHAAASVHNYFYKNGYTQIHAPILTANDCEGGGETFIVKPHNQMLLKQMKKEDVPIEQAYFDRQVCLSVSGQLHLEAMCHGLGDVYTFGPTFRAENSKSSIHLSEFYMIEAEQCFLNTIDDVVNSIEDIIKSVTRDVLDRCELDVINATPERRPADYSWLDKSFPTLTYAEAINILDKNKDSLKSNVSFNDGINKEQELFLVKHVGLPVFIVDWPKSLKPFYMRQSRQNPTLVEALDFLAPFVGELVGGSLREDDYDRLVGVVPNELIWYLDLRKFGGITTGGFGLGFERYLQMLLSITNIKDVIPFPRWAHNCKM